MGALFTLLKRSVTSFGTDRCATLSAAIAYRTIFSLFPMALVGVSILGFFVSDGSARERVAEGIGSVITLGPEGEQALSDTLGGVSSAKGIFGIVGLLLALWSASGLFGEIRTAFNAVWDVDRPQPMLRAKATDILLFLGFGGLLAASTAATGVLTAARDTSAGWLGPLADAATPLVVVLTIGAPPLLTLAAFLFLYRFAPHARLSFRDVLPAALIAMVFFEFGKNLLTYYITKMGDFNALASSLGAAILFLVFVYYTAQVILFAAEIAKHRLLVRAGTLPATDPARVKSQQPLGERLQTMASRLWAVGEPHHDRELPYRPARLDPATNRPTNTREEVMVKWEDATRTSEAAAAEMDHLPNQRFTPPEGPQPPRIHVVAGEVRRHGERLFIQSETRVTPLEPREGLKVTRNGAETALEALHGGDWATATLDAHGTVCSVDASDQVALKSGPLETAQGAGQAAGMLGTLVMLLFRRLKHESGNGKQPRERQGNEPATILRRKPSR